MALKRGLNNDPYELELKGLLPKKSLKNKGRGSSAGNVVGHQSFGSHYHPRRKTEYIERIVLETDTLPGLALLYNSTVAEIKKLNHLYTEHDLHARRTIKVPSRGILINLEDPIERSSTTNYKKLVTDTSSASTSSHTVTVSNNTFMDHDEPEINANDQMTLYLNTKDNFLQEIREKADVVAANSPIMNGTSDEDVPTLTRRKGSTLKWWHILIPCLSFIIIFPILLFLFQEHIFEHLHNETLKSPPSNSHQSSSIKDTKSDLALGNTA